ncbi:carbon monoxide dehydrogenase subunit G [Herbihabitans rhizosphaerae]|uniref:Carbon monoxide dehydrogenase subunit G n=1 Tax=Herbihabitans rhizosphaerae TaxID=1872711 RepID=A0A4Q7KEQ1_9PSEU|nr:SRPBCC family protein [Herbihabitans rhizosphaerae]RZS32734.1 carbon monoxide dehydrogenase subunit G [Herbihabitans rhizosphaerae]
MARVSEKARVPATPEHAWKTASDLSRLGEWLSLHEGWRGELPDEITEGTELISVVTVKGLRNRINWRVEVMNAPEELRISGKGVGGVKVTLDLSIRPDGSGSTVAFDAEITGPPTIGPMGLVIGRALRGDVRKSVKALAELVA